MNEVFLLLGANLGNPVGQLAAAFAKIGNEVGEITAYSSLYESEAWGVADQPTFLNQVIRVATSFSPLDVLDKIQAIEDDLGRVRIARWGARVIDIDILYFNREHIQHDRLIVPHPYLPDRRFVLLPLSEIAPNFTHPILGISTLDLLAQCEDNLQVNLYSETMKTSYQVINPSTIQANLSGDRAMISEFLDLYIEQVPVDLRELKEAVISGVHSEIARMAHHLKPTMSYVGAQALHEQLQQLEKAGKGGADISSIHLLFQDIEREITAMLQEITAYRLGLKKKK